MSYSGKIRSNYRMDGQQDLGNVLVGGNLALGSFLPAAASGQGGASNLGGGFIMGSFASLANSPGWVGLSAQGVISAFYGTVPGVNGSGWKWVPVLLQEGSNFPSFNWDYRLSTTGAIASQDSVVVIQVQLYAAAATTSAHGATSAGGISVRFVYAGWIVSTAP